MFVTLSPSVPILWGTEEDKGDKGDDITSISLLLGDGGSKGDAGPFIPVPCGGMAVDMGDIVYLWYIGRVRRGGGTRGIQETVSPISPTFPRVRGT